MVDWTLGRCSNGAINVSTRSLEPFLAQFDVFSRHNQLSASDKVAFLRCSLDKADTQLLWDFWASANVTYEQRLERLHQQYGSEDTRRQSAPNFSIGDSRWTKVSVSCCTTYGDLSFLQIPCLQAREQKDAFLEAIRDKELALKVREREPKTIDEAYRAALWLAANQHSRTR